MKVLIYGGKGWIGSQFAALCIGHDVVTSDTRVDDHVAIRKEIETILPDRVVCMIGRTSGPGYNNIDYLEQQGKLVENIHDNLYGPLLLANVCNDLGIHMTYMGTGCIFSYTDDAKTFTEQDGPNFYGSSYSVVKGYTDRLMNMYPNVLNVRIRMPIVGVIHPKNFITKITSYERVYSVPNSMTVLDELLPIMVDMMVTSKVGTINMTNPGAISHDEVLQMYKEIVDPTFIWSNFSVEDQRKVLKAERSNNELDTTKLTQWYPDVCNIHDAVRKALLRMAGK